VSAHVTNQQIAGGCRGARIPSPQLNRGDGKAYMFDDTDPDLVPRLRDPGLLNAALADDLRTVMGQIASGKDGDQLDSSRRTDHPKLGGGDGHRGSAKEAAALLVNFLRHPDASHGNNLRVSIARNVRWKRGPAGGTDD
jgi:hypothetical protein